MLCVNTFKEPLARDKLELETDCRSLKDLKTEDYYYCLTEFEPKNNEK